MTFMANRAKNHHIVPQVLQKQFAIPGDQKRIWRAKKIQNGTFQSLELKRIAKSFIIKDYYTILENNERSDIIERELYGKIDDFLGRLLPDVIDALNRGITPKFSKETLDSIREIIIHMVTRTPDFLEHDDVGIGKEVVENTLQALSSENSAEQRKQLEADLSDDIQLRDLGRHLRVTAKLKNSPRVRKALTEYVPRWSVSHSKHSYILSSKMVYLIGNGGPNGLSNPKMEMWMPITPKITLVLVRDPKNRIPHLVIDTPEHIRQVNEFAVKRSFEVASHSQKLLKSLIKL